MSFLYLLADSKAPSFKIGITGGSVVDRIRSLPEDIDISKSFYAECSKQASTVESVVHMMFSDCRITDKVPGSGYTEWFSDGCFADVKQFLEVNSDRLGLGEFHHLSSAIAESRVSFRRGNPAYRQFSAYIPAEVYRDMKIQLASDDLDLSAGVEEAVIDWIKKRRQKM